MATYEMIDGVAWETAPEVTHQAARARAWLALAKQYPSKSREFSRARGVSEHAVK